MATVTVDAGEAMEQGGAPHAGGEDEQAHSSRCSSPECGQEAEGEGEGAQEGFLEEESPWLRLEGHTVQMGAGTPKAVGGHEGGLTPKVAVEPLPWGGVRSGRGTGAAGSDKQTGLECGQAGRREQGCSQRPGLRPRWAPCHIPQPGSRADERESDKLRTRLARLPGLALGGWGMGG